MSDRPNDRKSNEPEKSGEQRAGRGGWRAPNQTSAAVPSERNAWRAPSEEETPSESWRVPTLPRELDVKSARQGAWHLPQPEDTPYSAEHESVITPEAPSEITEIIPPTGSTAAENGAPAEGDTVAESVLPFDGEAESQPLELLDEDEDDSFSMSELVALASLVDNVPSVEVQPSHSTSEVPAAATEAETTDEQAAGTSEGDQPLDPAEYARRELERLQQAASSAEAAVEAVVDSAAPTTTDSASVEAIPAESESNILSPEEYARQQHANLGAAQAEPAAAEQAAQPSLADKFRQAETNIRALRQQYQQGSLTRDQFQSELRRLMVLDENNVWWMMGVESDRWYRHENGQWVPATPPALTATESAAADAVQGTDLGNEGDRTVPTSPITEWIPRRVPVSDPDFTVPNTGGIYLNNEQTADTIPMATVPSDAMSGATVPNPAIQMQYESVTSPIAGAAEEPPSYDAEEASPTYEDAVARQRQQTVRTIAIIAAVGVALLFLLGALGAIGIVLYYNSLATPYRDAIAGLANYQPQFRTARILAADGSLIAQLSSPQGGLRDEISLSDVSPEMVHALVSIENERYFEDPGFDPVAITRAFVQNLSAGEIESGASTITQQIARALILQDTTVSAERKLQEIVVAAEIARTYDKNFILELYLNEFFFGNQSYGVEAASQFYFGHSAADLNLPEAALLAGLLQAPARYDPVINREAAFDRMDVVLEQMASVGCLQFSFAPYNTSPGFCVSQADITSPRVVLQKAQVETRNYQPRQFTVRYPHFVNFVQQQIENSFGTDEMFRRGFEIRTTLIPRIQETAQDALEAQVDALAGNGVNTGAVMVSDPRDGAIRAMVGSPDFSDVTIDGQVNNAFTWQQPGSSIKIVEYIGALEGVNRNGVNDYYTPATVLWDVPTTFQNPTYQPINYDRQFRGPVAVRYALANSYNVPAVKVLNFIGIDKFLDVAQRVGLRFLPEAQFSLASALGANEVRLYDMMQAYGTIANDGTRVPLYSITGIRDATGTDLALPERAQPALAIQPQTAFLLQNILSDNTARTPAFGANSPLNINGYPGLVAAKTGTSNDNRDLWTMGFTSNMVVGVWIGRVDNGPTNNTSGLAAAPIWNAVMTAALQGTNVEPFNPPQGIVQQQICTDTGTIYDPNASCTAVRSEYFMQSAPPPPAGQGFVVSVPVDTWTNLRANQFCSESVVTQTFINISDSSAVAWLGTPQGAAWAASLGLPNPPRPAPTTECSTSTVLPQVRFTSPTNGQQLTGSVQFTGVATGPNFARWQIELAPASAPDNFQVIVPAITSQANGNLAIWDSTTVVNGAYKLRLAAFSTDGGYRYHTIDIGINNIPPTPTLAPPTLPPPTVIIPIPTTDPFATPIPALSNQLAPTPTIFMSG